MKEENIFGIDEKNLQTVLVQKLTEKGLKIATAESITGGYISKRITDVSGSSNVFECGICCYSNRIKNQVLGVSEEILQTYTEYSSQTAVSMAEQVRKLSGADIGISTTGLASSTDNYPAGLVYVGISTKNNSFSNELHLRSSDKNQREYIRYTASSYALYMALCEIEKL